MLKLPEMFLSLGLLILNLNADTPPDWNEAVELIDNRQEEKALRLLDGFARDVASPYFAEANERIFEIASRMADREIKLKMLGFKVLDGFELAIEAFNRTQERCAGSELAERAGWKLAVSLEARGYYLDAEKAFSSFILNYKDSPLVPEARLRRLKAAQAQFIGVEYDVSPLERARLYAEELIKLHPELAEPPEARHKPSNAD